MRWVRLSNLKVDPDLASIFPIRPKDLEAVEASMRARGYDVAEPLVVWDDVVVDGHTRREAAERAGIEKVYVEQRVFADKRDATEYAIARQRDRRNLSAKEMAGFVTRAVLALDSLKPQGARTDLASTDAKSGKSAAETADKVGVSQAQVERVRTVLASEDEAVKEQLRNGEVTVNAAYTLVRDATQARRDSAPVDVPESHDHNGPLGSCATCSDLAPAPLFFPIVTVPGPGVLRASYSAAEWQILTDEQQAAVIATAPLMARSTFNETNDNIDWAKWSWNPVTGCLHNCAYCYARDIAERFYDQKFVPTFMPSRLHAPRASRQPEIAQREVGWRNVFVCSMADLFGKWVPQAWIDAVFEQIIASPQWNFLCLTKFPQRLAELEWPDNAWCGTTVDYQYRVDIAERSFKNVRAGVKWLSCEPLMERLTFTSLEMFDWVVIGAASKSSQTPEFQPPWEWVEHLLLQARAAGCKVYMKPNLKSRAAEYPTSSRLSRSNGAADFPIGKVLATHH